MNEPKTQRPNFNTSPSPKDRRLPLPHTLALLIGALTGGVIVGGLAAPRGISQSDIPDELEARNRLYTVLKNVDKTDQLIEILKDKWVDDALLNDPEIIRNLQKLADAFDGHVRETIDKKVQQLQERKGMMENTKSSWMKWINEKKIQTPTGQTQQGNP